MSNLNKIMDAKRDSNNSQYGGQRALSNKDKFLSQPQSNFIKIENQIPVTQHSSDSRSQCSIKDLIQIPSKKNIEDRVMAQPFRGASNERQNFGTTVQMTISDRIEPVRQEILQQNSKELIGITNNLNSQQKQVKQLETEIDASKRELKRILSLENYLRESMKQSNQLRVDQIEQQIQSQINTYMNDHIARNDQFKREVDQYKNQFQEILQGQLTYVQDYFKDKVLEDKSNEAFHKQFHQVLEDAQKSISSNYISMFEKVTQYLQNIEDKSNTFQSNQQQQFQQLSQDILRTIDNRIDQINLWMKEANNSIYNKVDSDLFKSTIDEYISSTLSHQEKSISQMKEQISQQASTLEMADQQRSQHILGLDNQLSKLTEQDLALLQKQEEKCNYLRNEIDSSKRQFMITENKVNRLFKSSNSQLDFEDSEGGIKLMKTNLEIKNKLDELLNQNKKLFEQTKQMVDNITRENYSIKKTLEDRPKNRRLKIKASAFNFPGNQNQMNSNSNSNSTNYHNKENQMNNRQLNNQSSFLNNKWISEQKTQEQLHNTSSSVGIIKSTALDKIDDSQPNFLDHSKSDGRRQLISPYLKQVNQKPIQEDQIPYNKDKLLNRTSPPQKQQQQQQQQQQKQQQPQQQLKQNNQISPENSLIQQKRRSGDFNLFLPRNQPSYSKQYLLFEDKKIESRDQSPNEIIHIVDNISKQNMIDLPKINEEQKVVKQQQQQEEQQQQQKQQQFQQQQQQQQQQYFSHPDLNNIQGKELKPPLHHQNQQRIQYFPNEVKEIIQILKPIQEPFNMEKIKKQVGLEKEQEYLWNERENLIEEQENMKKKLISLEVKRNLRAKSIDEIKKEIQVEVKNLSQSNLNTQNIEPLINIDDILQQKSILSPPSYVPISQSQKIIPKVEENEMKMITIEQQSQRIISQFEENEKKMIIEPQSQRIIPQFEENEKKMTIIQPQPQRIIPKFQENQTKMMTFQPLPQKIIPQFEDNSKKLIQISPQHQRIFPQFVENANKMIRMSPPPQRMIPQFVENENKIIVMQPQPGRIIPQFEQNENKMIANEFQPQRIIPKYEQNEKNVVYIEKTGPQLEEDINRVKNDISSIKANIAKIQDNIFNQKQSSPDQSQSNQYQTQIPDKYKKSQRVALSKLPPIQYVPSKIEERMIKNEHQLQNISFEEKSVFQNQSQDQKESLRDLEYLRINPFVNNNSVSEGAYKINELSQAINNSNSLNKFNAQPSKDDKRYQTSNFFSKNPSKREFSPSHPSLFGPQKMEDQNNLTPRLNSHSSQSREAPLFQIDPTIIYNPQPKSQKKRERTFSVDNVKKEPQNFITLSQFEDFNEKALYSPSSLGNSPNYFQRNNFESRDLKEETNKRQAIIPQEQQWMNEINNNYEEDIFFYPSSAKNAQLKIKSLPQSPLSYKQAPFGNEQINQTQYLTKVENNFLTHEDEQWLEKIVKRRLLYNNKTTNSTNKKLKLELCSDNTLKDNQNKFLYDEKGNAIQFSKIQLQFFQNSDLVEMRYNS